MESSNKSSAGAWIFGIIAGLFLVSSVVLFILLRKEKAKTAAIKKPIRVGSAAPAPAVSPVASEQGGTTATA